MPSRSAFPGADRLLQASPARTVVARPDASGAAWVVVKVFVTGAMVDAEREFALARLAAGPGVVEPLSVGTDAASNRPAVTMRHEDGVDLARWVAERGALPAAEACTLLAPVARTLARLHGLTTKETPRGLLHGDVKPSNLLRTATTTLLLDFEHTRAIGEDSGSPLPIGTLGFAAPELTHGPAAAAAQDVFALGATLAWLLDGGSARQPWPASVQALVAACTAEVPTERPSATTVAERLERLATELCDDAEQALQHDWATGSFRLPADQGERSAVWRHRRRIADTRPSLLTPPPGVPGEPAGVLTALRRTIRVLQRFPRHDATLRWRGELLRSGGRLVMDAPQRLQSMQRDDEFAAAAAWLDDLDQLLRLAVRLPGGLPIPADETGGAGLAQRDPLAFLQRLRRQLALDATELAEQQATIVAATGRLDLRAAELAIEQVAARHGGTAAVVARHRDRLHRLAFHLERVGRAAPSVARLEQLWPTTDLQPLQSVVATAVRATHRHGHLAGDGAGAGRGGDVGLRSLQRTLDNIAADFPGLGAVADALAVLSQALTELSDQAIGLLHEAKQRLATIPVPVRPLQLLLGRLDTFRLLEALVDRPGRKHGELLDDIEALRLALDQARATRDRLAESAEHALARGHWTTGLFDMERAVAGLQPSDDHEQAQAERLQEKLAAARRRKLEVESTARRNVELGATYATLQDDPQSTFERRLQVLAERRDSLTFLAMHAPSDRAALYRRDLRDVETAMALERAAIAEQQFYATADPVARWRLASATLDQLANSVTTSEDVPSPPGRVLRLLEHWRALASDCQAAVDQLHAAAAQRARHRRRVVAFAALALLATGAAIVFAVRPWLQATPTYAGERGR